MGVVFALSGAPASGQTWPFESDDRRLTIGFSTDGAGVDGKDPAEEVGPGAEASNGDLVVLPAGEVFRPLLADPRQVRSFVSYQRFNTDFGRFTIGSVGFGETFGIVGQLDDEGNGWQLNLSGYAASFFNLDGFDNDLINTDFMVGFPFSWRSEPFSFRVSLYHQSSHLSDEFFRLKTFGPPVSTDKLSFEPLDVVAAWEPTRGSRLYVGGARIIRSSNSIDRWWFRGGGDWLGEPLDRAQHLRPIGGVDVRIWEETGYTPEISVKAGMQLSTSRFRETRVSVLLEWFDGPYYHGQFFVHEVEYVALGLLFQF